MIKGIWILLFIFIIYYLLYIYYYFLFIIIRILFSISLKKARENAIIRVNIEKNISHSRFIFLLFQPKRLTSRTRIIIKYIVRHIYRTRELSLLLSFSSSRISSVPLSLSLFLVVFLSSYVFISFFAGARDSRSRWIINASAARKKAHAPTNGRALISR